MHSTRIATVDIWGRGAPVALHTSACSAAVFQVVYCAEVSSMALFLRVTRFELISVADVVLHLRWQALGTVPVATARITASIIILMLRALNLAIAT